MKLEDNVREVTSNLQGEEFVMGIDDEDMPMLMSIVTDIYSDSELAILREYSTNALDEHQESGQTRPVEVTLPAPLSPYVKIRDYGRGMDENDIRKTYSRYGRSTKRESNEVVGCLGIGSKSALTYSDHFTVTSIKNGRKIQVVVGRKEDGTGVMTPVYNELSDEPSGTEIMVPAKAGNTFETKARNLFQFWQNGTVLVNGKEPNKIDGTWLDDKTCLVSANSMLGIDKSFVVMGNVPYPMLPDRTASYTTRNGMVHVISFVDIGDVIFTPSREALQTVKKNHDALDAIKERVEAKKRAHFEKMIEACTTNWSALAKYFEVKQLGYNGNPVWRGKEMPLNFTAPVKIEKDRWGNDLKVYEWEFVLCDSTKSTYRRYKGWESTRQVGNCDAYGRPINYVWVTGFDAAELTPYRREKLYQYMARVQPGTRVDKYVLVPELPEGAKDWIKNQVHDWKVIEKEKIIRDNVKRNDGRISGSYPGFVGGKYVASIVANNIDQTKPIFWGQGSANSYYASRMNGMDVALAKHPDATIVILGQNRVNKFKRDFPTAKNLGTFAREQAEAWVKALSHDDLLSLYFADNESEASKLRKLDESLIDDPELSTAVKLAKDIQTNAKALKANWSLYEGYGARYERIDWKNPLDKYVLLTSIHIYGNMSAEFKSHVYHYMNAAYAASKKGV